jgi:hypothetical protein
MKLLDSRVAEFNLDLTSGIESTHLLNLCFEGTSMILGMPLSTFTAVHVAISLAGIGSGFIVILGMIGNLRLNILTHFFLATTVLTSVTGFFFPFHGMTPGIILGILSLIALIFAIIDRYRFHLAGKARATYVVCSVLAQWFNVFVLIAQSFQKVPALHALAPKGSEPPFLIAQVIALLLLIVLGTLAFKKFHPTPFVTA